MEQFKNLGLSEKSLSALEKKGFEEPTEIQALTIPLLLENKNIDIIAQAQTGTGKTAAFALPIIENINPDTPGVQAIILAPTRELVIQICEEMNSLKNENKISIAPIYGGQSIEMQLRKLKKGITVVVGTPGRILDHIRRKTLKLGGIKYFILDEADEMLNMGFIDDIEKILDHTNDNKRVLLFSATMPNSIKKLAEKYMKNYEHIKTKTDLTTNLTDQIYFEVTRPEKFEALSRIIDIEPNFYGIIFCRTRGDVDEIASKLMDRGYMADGLHGDISQGQREKILGKFRRKTLSVLVATDVAARGIDVKDISHVINYSIPQDPEAYIHRIGRTGRAGTEGTAVTFVTPAEFRKLGFIKKVTKADIRKEEIPEIADIISARKKKITQNIKDLVDSDEMGKYTKWALKLFKIDEPEKILAAVLKDAYGQSLQESNYKKINTKRGKGINNEFSSHGQTRLFIAKGKKDNMTKSKMIEFIVSQAGISERHINDLQILDTFSFINVPFVEAEIILDKFKREKNEGKSIVVKAKTSKGGGGGGGGRSGDGRTRKRKRRSQRR